MRENTNVNEWKGYWVKVHTILVRYCGKDNLNLYAVWVSRGIQTERISQYGMYLVPHPYNIRNLIFLLETMFISQKVHTSDTKNNKNLNSKEKRNKKVGKSEMF